MCFSHLYVCIQTQVFVTKVQVGIVLNVIEIYRFKDFINLVHQNTRK